MDFNLNLRRNRLTDIGRDLVAQVQLNHQKFVQPIFVEQHLETPRAVPNLNEVFNDTVSSVIETIEKDMAAGVRSFLLFVNPTQKENNPTDFLFHQQVIKTIKDRFQKEIYLIADICLCGITQHGHCGVLNEANTELDNDKSVQKLAEMALACAQAGVDCVAPSDMNDGTVAGIRMALDDNGYENVSLMAYSTKFLSSMYGPFREAHHSAPAKVGQLKGRASYQIDPRNKKDAILSSYRDMEQGADMLMVKPSINYLDIIHEIKELTLLPVVAYHVSGEYTALELLAENGIANRKDAHLEAWIALARSGADIIISYAARHAKDWINAQD